MKTITGAYSTAKIFTDNVEDSALEQLRLLCDQPFASGSRIRVMPDVHTGAGCVIGFTADLGEMVIPNIVGVDIGCGMLTVELGRADVDPAHLDEVIRAGVPSGKNVHEGRLMHWQPLQQLECFRALKDTRRIERSIGTLGGGNHFIELDRDDGGNLYLVIHTGSRNLGKQVAEHYQQLAWDLMRGKDKLLEQEKQLIAEYKAQGRRTEIQAALKKLVQSAELHETDTPKELCYLTGEYRQHYLHDMRLCQQFAALNRLTIARIILKDALGIAPEDCTYFETVHNYIDHDSNLVRKGAVSARAGERLLIPINMRDGSLLCTGLGNPDWNFSAPHGAGRLFSRSGARAAFTVEEYSRQMEGVYTTSVNESTLDECPMAYKSLGDILDNIGPTARLERILKPLYNFKAGE